MDIQDRMDLKEMAQDNLLYCEQMGGHIPSILKLKRFANTVLEKLDK